MLKSLSKILLIFFFYFSNEFQLRSWHMLKLEELYIKPDCIFNSMGVLFFFPWSALTRYSQSTATSGVANCVDIFWPFRQQTLFIISEDGQRCLSVSLSVFWAARLTWFTFFSHIKFYFMWTLFNSSRRRRRHSFSGSQRPSKKAEP